MRFHDTDNDNDITVQFRHQASWAVFGALSAEGSKNASSDFLPTGVEGPSVRPVGALVSYIKALANGCGGRENRTSAQSH